METMSQSLRIKEDSYVNIFMEKEKVLKESKGNLIMLSWTKPNLETDNAFLREKLQVSEEKRKMEIDFNLDIYCTVKLHSKAARTAALDYTDKKRKRFFI